MVDENHSPDDDKADSGAPFGGTCFLQPVPHFQRDSPRHYPPLRTVAGEQYHIPTGRHAARVAVPFQQDDIGSCSRRADRRLAENRRPEKDRRRTPRAARAKRARGEGDRDGEKNIYREEICSRIVDLKFPQYEKVIVRDRPFRARVNRAELLSSLRRVSLMANEKAKGVRFAFDPAGDLTLQSFGYERGEAHETLSALYQGEAIEVSLNASFVIDFLQVLDVEVVEFQMKSRKNQTILVPVDDDPRLEEYVYVLMPMRV